MKSILYLVFLLVPCFTSGQWTFNSENAFGGDTTFQPEFYFISENEGYCITGRNAKMEGDIRHNAIYKTTNACQSWVRINTHKILNATYGIDGYGADTLIVGLGNNRVIRSQDGGMSWDTVFNSSGKPICFPGGQVLLLGDTSLWSSIDYGTNWTYVSGGTYYNVFMQFASPSIGYYLDRNSKQLKRTNNGGATWNTEYTFPFAFGMTDYYLHVASEKVLFLLANQKFMRSIDGGKSWSEVLDLGNKVNNNSEGIYSINEKDVFYSFRGIFYKSNDTGRTWCEQSPTLNSTAVLSRSFPMYFVNDSVGVWAHGGSSKGITISTTTNQGGPACPSSPGTGMEETKVSTGLRVYPNPSTGQFRLSLESGNLRQVEVYSASGQLILTKTLQGQIVEFSLKSTPGLYLVRVLDDQGIWRHQKVLVN